MPSKYINKKTEAVAKCNIQQYSLWIKFVDIVKSETDQETINRLCCAKMFLILMSKKGKTEKKKDENQIFIFCNTFLLLYFGLNFDFCSFCRSFSINIFAFQIGFLFSVCYKPITWSWALNTKYEKKKLF